MIVIEMQSLDVSKSTNLLSNCSRPEKRKDRKNKVTKTDRIAREYKCSTGDEKK